MKKLSRRQFLKLSATVVAGSLLADAFWLEKFFIETKRFRLNTTASGGQALRLIQVSDLHLNKIRWQHRQLARTLNELSSDLILFTGDSIDKANNLDLLDTFLRSIDYKIQKVAILGNWEYWGNVDIEALRGICAKHNCTLLVNESRRFEFGKHTVSITGIDDFIGGDADFRKAIKQFEPSDYHMVLTHCPAHRDVIEQEKGNYPIDLILSGHTHGGQVNILGWVPFRPRGSGRYVRGWYRGNGTPMYVSKGIGTSILPIRFGARAEIAVFELEFP